ncbi:Tn3 family transposase [Azohydromonas caseinilytica]|uniref:Tn3 family transposase n=1 Tax=Azohydromonas caseinilytica TaxID=2728836 RepID=A0A848FEP3_9BURK|nr:Tn3 family transposase [Azohydromonas caseinilytica]NML17305.1 Tn3 family transposase [Azohydromonas caseinilytica]
MSAFADRFVGCDALPSRLSDFDREHFFTLSKADVQALQEQFREEHRLAAALLVMFMRVAGRSLDGFTMLPRNLLRYAAEALGVAAPSIASLRSIYKRKQTLFAHQRWARDYLGLTELGPDQEREVVAMLEVQAQAAAHTDDLVQAARQWLFGQRIVIPSSRRLLDWARDAFAKTEAQVAITIAQAVGHADAARLLVVVYALRPGTDVTHLEWLKTPPRRHSPTTLAETMEKVRYLKSLRVHQWDLSGVMLQRQQAYARQVRARRPYKSRALHTTTQLVEVACFLHVTLLELTDAALHLSGRRTRQLARTAAERARTRHARESADALRQAVQARALLHDDTRDWRSRVLEARELLAGIGDGSPVSFASRVRQALAEDSTRVHACLAVLADLEFRGGDKDAGFAQWQAWQALRQRAQDKAAAPGELPDVGAAWRSLVHDADPKAGWRAFEASTMLALRRSLRRGSVWIDHSLSFQGREQMLIPAQQWQQQHRKHVELLGVPVSFDSLLMPLVANIHAGMQALVLALRRGKVEIGADGMLHLPALAALPDDGEPVRTREALYRRIGDVQLPDVILEVDAATNFSEALLGHRAASPAELTAMYGALLVHGTDLDARGVAHMIPGLEPAQIISAMRAMEGSGRLRRANERVAGYQSSIPLAALWGNGDKASADMLALDASRHLWSARVDPRRRTYAAGIYTHLRDRWGIVYDQPIVLNERQAGVAIEGVEQHNRIEDRLRLSLLAVDTHGYTNVAMAVAKLLGFDLCPRLKDLAERKLYLPRPFNIPEELDRITERRVSLKAIERGWPELLRVAASIRSGRVSAAQMLQRLGSAAQGDPLHRAAEHLGRLLRTVFLCDYLTVVDFRREIHMLLSRGESVHQLQRAVYSGRIAPERGRRPDEMRAISGAHALLTNVVLAWNTARMHEEVEKLRREGVRIDDDWLRRIGPANFGHINFRGTMRFGVERFAQALLHDNSAATRLRTG